MRAVTVPVSATTGVAGFVFPGDRVDIVLTQTVTGTQGQPLNASETILRNLRVLATDQSTTQEVVEGKTVVRAVRTVTLEVTPKIAEKIAVAETIGDTQPVAALAGGQPERARAGSGAWRYCHSRRRNPRRGGEAAARSHGTAQRCARLTSPPAATCRASSALPFLRRPSRKARPGTWKCRRAHRVRRHLRARLSTVPPGPWSASRAGSRPPKCPSENPDDRTASNIAGRIGDAGRDRGGPNQSHQGA